MRTQIRGKHGEVAPALDDSVQQAKRLWRIGAKQRVRDVEEKRILHAAEHVIYVLRGHVIPAEREALICERQRVAHAALRRARNQRQSAVLNAGARAGKHAGERAFDVRDGDSVKVEPLAAGDDRCGELLRLGRRENKQNVLRRLLQRFEQRVERRAGEHMNFVDDKHAAAQAQRRVLCALDEVAHVADAVVARRVNFCDVRGTLARGDEACLAFAARLAILGREAVHRAREDACRGGLARAARAAEQIGVCRAIRRNLMLQRCGDMLLPNHFRKADGAVLAVERAIGHSFLFSVCIQLISYHSSNGGKREESHLRLRD